MQHPHLKQQDHHQNDEECDDERDHKLLIEALSNATRVVENESFDPNNDDKNGNDDDQQQDKQQHRYHPTGIDLRTELEKRWNDLIVATTTTDATKAKAVSSSELEADGTKYNSSCSSSSSSSFWFQKLYDQHNESGRYYHTMVHLWEMFQLLDILSSSTSSSTSLSTTPASSSSYYIPMAWAIFFHDVVYDPKSNQNEKDSAKLFHEFYNTYYCNEEEQEQRNNIRMRIMNDVTFENISTMIIATEKHEVIPVLSTTQQQQQQRLLSTTTEKPSGEEEDDDDDDDEIEYILQMQRYFLDIDMTVLGKRQNAYLKYASLIRKEFAFVPRDVYCTKRAEILETFLGDGSSSSKKDKKYIYLTKTFQEAFEERARTNLREEINLLRKNIIPGEKE